MKQLSLTLAELRNLDPCDMNSREALFTGRKSLTAKQAFKAGSTISDILWVLGRTGLKETCVKFALLSAQRVAHNNSDPRVQLALNATQAWINNPCPKTESAAWSAARSAESASESAA